ncbi:hypothetical protein GALMADRAFT_136004 [Galerina marginata CBS 339.88]|uniref:Protein kinase domain-containing protein n=1 Tax=Galerina marginata (strain CBS 339.88) TaxID=685588 RepID=A0A067TCQ6_GALM3|nr:hypothetical protein GALMADRAFT_136004 [Galerina marginata CBS 339.88]
MPAFEQDSMLDELVDTPGLIDYLFPDKSLPLPSAALVDVMFSSFRFFDLAEDYLHSVTLTSSLKSWNAGERKLAKFLNILGDELVGICAKANVHLKSRPRRWHSKDHAFGLVAGSLFESKVGAQDERNPELILLEDDVPPATCKWSQVLVHGEMHHKKETTPKTASQRLANGAQEVFFSQDGRRFHIGVSFTAYDIRLHVFDRAGLVGSRSFNLRQQPSKFLHCVAGLLLADFSAIGYDPSITRTPDDRRFITIDGKEYELLEPVFVNEDIWGRGTLCWRGHRDGVDYAIKDVWALFQSDQDHSEADILRRASGVEGMAQIVADEVVQIDGKDDSTANIRGVLETTIKKCSQKVLDWVKTLEVRVHRRIVTTPFGRELSHFSSKKELLSVFIDAIAAHERLVHKGILHRDISYGNILLYRPPAEAAETMEEEQEPSLEKASKVGGQKGLLIDLDFATFMDEQRKEPNDKEPIGTTPFIAVELLMGLAGEETRHEPRHDLESFFYVLLWMCWNFAGPNNTPRVDFDITQTKIQAMMLGSKDHSMGTRKHLYMTNRLNNDVLFQIAVLENFAPYFEDLKPCVKKLRQRIFTEPNDSARVFADISHQEFIDILKETRDTLPDEKAAGKKGRCIMIPNQKRRRDSDSESESDGTGGQRRKLRPRAGASRFIVSEEI